MRKVVVKYGLLAGLIVSLLVVLTFLLIPRGSELSHSMVIGYANMLIALSMIYFAIKTYRDDYSEGFITWGRGFMVGLYVTLIASVLYVIGWNIFSAIAMPNFWDDYAKHAIEAMRSEGASDAAILAQTQEIAGYKNMNPILMYAFEFMEIFPVGLFISAISAAVLRKTSASKSPVLTTT